MIWQIAFYKFLDLFSLFRNNIFTSVYTYTKMSCPFSNLFGTPNEGLHSIRIADIAVVTSIRLQMLL